MQLLGIAIKARTRTNTLMERSRDRYEIVLSHRRTNDMLPRDAKETGNYVFRRNQGCAITFRTHTHARARVKKTLSHFVAHMCEKEKIRALKPIKFLLHKTLACLSSLAR